jgi:hypothetical protein
MIILKQVIHFPDTNTLEATWVERTGEGEEAVDVNVRCHSYAPVQMDMFRADVAAYGGEVDEELVALVESSL